MVSLEMLYRDSEKIFDGTLVHTSNNKKLIELINTFKKPPPLSKST